MKSTQVPTVEDDAEPAPPPSPAPTVVQPRPPPTPPTLVVRVTLRRGLLATLTAVVIATLVLLTAMMQHGYSLRTYDRATTEPHEIEAFVDASNSYSGTVSSAVQRPIELFLGLVIQVVVLRFLAPHLLRRKPSIIVALVAMGLSGFVGFLLNNSLTALNVQQRDLPVEAIVVSSDLARNASDVARVGRDATTVNRTVSENTPQNAITNTVLRSLLLPRDNDPPTGCRGARYPKYDLMRDSVAYGLFQRDWMNDMLSDAVADETLTLVLNATTANASLTDSPQQPVGELPMDAALAADLFLTSVFWSPAYISWGKSNLWPPATRDGWPNDSLAANAMGLLPPDDARTDEREKRAWFVNHVTTFFNRWPVTSTNISRNNVVLQFSHVPLAPNITFDAITIEVDIEPEPRPFAVDNTTDFCQTYPYPSVCIFPKQRLDRPMQIHAFAWCSRANGSERLWTTPDVSSIDLEIAF